MKLIDVLQLNVLQQACVVTDGVGLEREVQWVHVVDHPEPIPWVRSGQLVLTTGYAWPQDPAQQQALVQAFAERGVAGVGFSVPHFLEHVPTPARAAANLVQLPLLEIPWVIPFAQITEEVNRAIVAEQYRVIAQSTAIHNDLTRAALEAESIHDLATTLGRLIGRAVIFEDQDGRVLAHHVIGGGEDALHRATVEQGHRPAEWGALLEQHRFTQVLHTQTYPLHVPAVHALGSTSRVVCPIRIKQEIVGFVWIIDDGPALSNLDLRAVEHAAIIAALHIAHQRALAAVEARLGASFLDSLLEGRFDAHPAALERALILGFNPRGMYRVGMLVLNVAVPLSHEGFLQRERLAERLRRRLQHRNMLPLLSVAQNQILFLLPEHCSGDDIWKTLAEPSVALAVGRLHAGAAGVQRSYNEVRLLLPYLQPGHVHSYDDLLLPRVLKGDVEAQAAFLDTLLNPLRQHKYGDVLIRSLLAFARSGFQLKRTALELSIHPQTLRYLMARAAELGWFDLEQPDTRFRLQLAAHLLSLTYNESQKR